MEYISSLHLLEQVMGSTKLINNPKGIRNAPEKISMLAHKKASLKTSFFMYVTN